MSRRKPKPPTEAVEQARQRKRSDESPGYAHMSAHAAAKALNVDPDLLTGLIRARKVEGFGREGKAGQTAWRVSKDAVKQLETDMQKGSRP